MIRMIAEKLSGQTGMSQDVIAVEEADQAPSDGSGANRTDSQSTIQVQQPTVARTPPTPIPMASPGPSPAPQSRGISNMFTALARFDWWGVTQTLLLIAVVVLLCAVERVSGV